LREKTLIEIVEHGDIREIRLARPPVNALDPGLVDTGLRAFDEAFAARTRAVVLSGQPGMFSAGLDVPALLRLDREQIARFWVAFLALQKRIAASPVPVIAAITGHCPAGGTVLTLYCDHRIVARGNYRMGLNEVQVGLCAGPIIHRAFERVVGARNAARLLVRGALLGPEEALAAGLVDEVTEPQDVVPRAIAHARELVALPTGAVARTRALVRADLVALFDARERQFAAEANEVWFDPETQRQLRALFQKP
jgi:enoyl-CoA hydratase/carnithine racemase